MAEKVIGSNVRPPPPINIVDFDAYRINNNWASSSSHHEIEEDDELENDGGCFTVMPPIREEYESDLFSYDISDVVYVVTWRGTEELTSASMDALLWTLGSNNFHHESSIVYLVHVFPELHFIPTPLGRLPISHANPEQKEVYVTNERSKRTAYLQKFVSLCSCSKVQVDTVLVESDMEAKAILDLIPILKIKKLVLGATKSSIRKLKSSVKKGGGGGTLDQIVSNAPEFCDVKIICEGKEVSLQDQSSNEASSPSWSASPHHSNVSTLKPVEVKHDQPDGIVICSCFKL